MAGRWRGTLVGRCLAAAPKPLLALFATRAPHHPSPLPACSYELPWEDKSFEYPASLAPPLQILIDASNGALPAQQCHPEILSVLSVKAEAQPPHRRIKRCAACPAMSP